MSTRRLPFAFALLPTVAPALALAMLALAGCPAPKTPTGPPPEYEDPPAPTWLDAGRVDAGSDAEASPPAPPPPVG